MYVLGECGSRTSSFYPLFALMYRQAANVPDFSANLAEVVKTCVQMLRRYLSKVETKSLVSQLGYALIKLNSPIAREMEELVAEPFAKLTLDESYRSDLLTLYLSSTAHEDLRTSPLIVDTPSLLAATAANHLNESAITATYTFGSLKPKYRRALMLRLAAAVAKEDSVHVLLRDGIKFGLAEVVRELVPRYVEGAEKCELKAANLLHARVKYPALNLVMNKEVDMDILTILRDKLPKPYKFKAEDELVKRFRSVGELGLLELAIFYRRTEVVRCLLENSEYRSHAEKNADTLVVNSLKAGSLELARIFLGIGGSELELKHLQLALSYLSDGECKEVIITLKERSSAHEMLNYRDEEGNNILHLIALYGRTKILLYLAKVQIFDFTARQEHRNKLLEKNAYKVCPFVTAIMMSHMDIANALSTLPTDMTPEEVGYIDRNLKPIQAWTQFTNRELFPTESRVWQQLFPNADTTVDFFGKFEIDSFISATHAYTRKMRVEKDVKRKESAEPLVRMVRNQEIANLLYLMLFRKDQLYLKALTDCKGKKEKKIFSVYSQNDHMAMFQYMLSLFGIVPRDKAELEVFFKDAKIVSDKHALFIMEIFKIMQFATVASNSNLRDAKANAMFITPFKHFTNNDFFEYNKVKFTREEINSVVPREAVIERQIYELDLSKLACQFLSRNFFKAFLTILLYASKHDSHLLAQINKQVNTQELFLVTFQEHQQSLPLLLKLLPRQFEIFYNPAEGEYFHRSWEGPLVWFQGDRTRSALVAFALLAAGKGLVLEKSVQAQEDVVRSVIENISYKFFVSCNKKYEERWKGKVGALQKVEAIEMEDVKRAMKMWSGVVKEAWEIVKNEDGVVLSENELLKVVAEVLNYSGVKLYYSGNSVSITFRLEDVIEIAQERSKEAKKNVVEMLCTLLGENYLIGIEENNSYSNKYSMNIKVQFINDSNKPPANYRILSIVKKPPPKQLDGENKAKQKHDTFKINLEYILNVDPKRFYAITTSLPQLNASLKHEINTVVIACTEPSKICIATAKSALLRFDIESIKQNYFVLENVLGPEVLQNLQGLVEEIIEKSFYAEAEYCKRVEELKSREDVMDRKVAEMTKGFAKLNVNSIKDLVLNATVMTPKQWSDKKVPMTQVVLETLERRDRAEWDLVFIVSPSEKQGQINLLRETFPMHVIGRLIASEAELLKRLLLEQKNLPSIRIDTQGFLTKIAMPIAETASGECTNPLLLAESYFSSSWVLAREVLELVLGFETLAKDFGRKVKTAVIRFERKKGTGCPASDGLVIDKLFVLAGCNVELREFEQEGFLERNCIVTFAYQDGWADKTLNAQQFYNKLKEDINAHSTKSKNSLEQHLPSVVHRVQILDAAFLNMAAVENYFREEYKMEPLQYLLSDVFGTKFQLVFDWESFFNVIKSKVRSEDSFESLKEYYAYVRFLLIQ